MILPEHILAKMSPRDRAEISRAAGSANAGRTALECCEIKANRREKEAQKEISQFLRISGIEFICPPMNRKSALPEGWPDFTFARNGVAMALEVKTNGNTARTSQKTRHDAMRANGWQVWIVSGAEDVKRIFREMDNL